MSDSSPVSPASPKPLISKSPPSTGHAEAAGVKLSIRKKYVLPPRPKPGRKPAAETPQNKRKAQNREAQRAFRERRAVAIHELEQKLGEENKRHAYENRNMASTIERLIRENETLRSQIMSSKSPNLLPALSPAGAGPSPVMSPYESASSPLYGAQSMRSPLDILDKVLDDKLPEPRQVEVVRSPRRASMPRSSRAVGGSPPCDGLALTETDWAAPAVPLRRRLSSLETDFTQRFKPARSQTLRGSANHAAAQKPSPLATTPWAHSEDRCGFCTDDTPCICAEAAKRERANMSDVETLGDTMANTFSSPSPLASPKPVAASPPSECSGNPGSCEQCQHDPLSTLFCATLATKEAPVVLSGTFIPAQIAYQTLSRHPNFSQADFGQVVENLSARGTRVEVNSVAKVLRMLDSRSS